MDQVRPRISCSIVSRSSGFERCWIRGTDQARVAAGDRAIGQENRPSGTAWRLVGTETNILFYGIDSFEASRILSAPTVQEVFMKGETDDLRQASRQWSRLLAAATATVATVAPVATILEATHSASTASTANGAGQTQPTLAGVQELVQALCMQPCDW